MACVAYGCNSNSSSKSEEQRRHSFHRFPEDENLKELWVKAIQRENWKPSPSSRLCSKHFTPECYLEGKKKKILRRSAIPTIFPNYPSYLQKDSSRLAQNHTVDLNRKIRAIQRNLQQDENTSSEPSKPSTSRRPCGKANGSSKSLDPHFDNTPREKKLRNALLKEARISASRLHRLRILQQKYRRLKQKNISLEKKLKSKKYLNNESNILNENQMKVQENTVNFLNDESSKEENNRENGGVFTQLQEGNVLKRYNLKKTVTVYVVKT